MKLAAALVFCAMAGGEALARSDEDVFRTVSFICASTPDSTAFIEKENILGQRVSIKVTFIAGVATLFVISKAKRGSSFYSVKHIDLRSDRNKSDIQVAHSLAYKISAEGSRYCWSDGAELQAARAELLGNHEFNRSHPRYRGK